LSDSESRRVHENVVLSGDSSGVVASSPEVRAMGGTPKRAAALRLADELLAAAERSVNPAPLIAAARALVAEASIRPVQAEAPQEGHEPRST
jgi:hypothetical protein